MAKAALFSAVVLVCIASTLAARVPPYILTEFHSEGFPAGLKSMAGHLKASLMQGMLRRHHDEEFMDTHSVAIRFTVPPSMGEDFEDEWMKLEKDVMDHEKNNMVYDLKKTKLDNLFYLAYGEWESHEDLMEHMSSDHFEEFAEFVDREGIRWSLEILKDMSADVDDKQRSKHKESSAELAKRKNMAHVLFMYIVPPGEDDDFVEQWTDTAYKTIDEDGNRIYSLRRVATDNTKFYGYGTWDSMKDYIRHFESRHVDDLLGYADSKDIVWFIAPMEKIGHQKE